MSLASQAKPATGMSRTSVKSKPGNKQLRSIIVRSRADSVPLNY